MSRTVRAKPMLSKPWRYERRYHDRYCVATRTYKGRRAAADAKSQVAEYVS